MKSPVNVFNRMIRRIKAKKRGENKEKKLKPPLGAIY